MMSRAIQKHIEKLERETAYNQRVRAAAPQMHELLRTILAAEFGNIDAADVAPGTYRAKAQAIIKSIEEKP